MPRPQKRPRSAAQEEHGDFDSEQMLGALQAGMASLHAYSLTASATRFEALDVPSGRLTFHQLLLWSTINRMNASQGVIGRMLDCQAIDRSKARH